MIKVSKPPPLTQKHHNVINRIVESNRLVNGKYTKQFEDAFSSFCDCNHGVATSNGTMALYSALKACNVQKGDNVIVPPLTFFATIEAVLWCGANPIFCDIKKDTWNMDADSVKSILQQHKIKAVLPVHIFGNPCDMYGIHEAVLKHGNGSEYIIEDCAQAHGALYDGKIVGCFGDVGCYSFMATKNMTNFGEGGICVSNIKMLADNIRTFINHGMVNRHTHESFGINGKCSEIECGLGLVELEKLPEYALRRAMQMSIYEELLSSVKWLIPQKQEKNAYSSRFWAGFYVDKEKLGYNAETLHNKLKELGIETRYRYTRPLWYQRACNVKYPKVLDEIHENAVKICGNIIGLPIGEHIKIEDQDYILDVIKTL